MTYLLEKHKPDYKTALNKAHIILKNHQVKEFPIDIFSMIESHDNISLITYENLAKQLNITIKDVIKMSHSEEGCLTHNPISDTYIIAYNDDPSKSMERIRFTLCHEYGHYILKHLIQTENCTIMRYNLTDDENEIFEKEANVFARELLAPVCLARLIQPLDPHLLSEYFYISKPVSEILIKHIHKCYENGWYYSLRTPICLMGQFKQVKLHIEYQNNKCIDYLGT